MKHSLKRGPWFFWGLLIVVAVFVADQVTKWAIVQHFFRPARIDEAMPFFEWLFKSGDVFAATAVPVTGFFNISMVWNHGVTFGMLGGLGPSVPVFLTGLTACLLVVLLVWLYLARTAMTGVGISLAVAGAFGNNIFDRVRFGAVIDFLDFHVAGYHWPSFNVADIAILVGFGLIVLNTMLLDRDGGKVKKSGV